MHTFIFDLDDTLIPCEVYYTERIRQAHELLTSKSITNLSWEAFLKLVWNENEKLINQSEGHFLREIFPTSLVFAYRIIANGTQNGIANNSTTNNSITNNLIEDKTANTDSAIEECLYSDIGESVFDKENYRNTLLPRAKKTLEFLKSRHEELILYTKGNDTDQRMKYEENNLGEFFPEIKITNCKNEMDILRIVGDRQADQVYMVGNSIRSDIVPANRAGIRSIYVPFVTWSYEDNHNGIENPSLVLVCNNIDEIIKYHPHLDTKWKLISLNSDYGTKVVI